MEKLPVDKISVSDIIAPDKLLKVTDVPVRRQETLEFAGFLKYEDKDCIYIADPQGTWIVRREDIVRLEDWHTDSAPQFMADAGKPVQVAVKNNATIHEIRPWRVQKHAGQFGPRVKEAISSIFTLGGNPLPVSERTMLGEAQLADLERIFARRIGWSPDYVPSANLDGVQTTLRSRGGSSTIVVNNGY